MSRGANASLVFLRKLHARSHVATPLAHSTLMHYRAAPTVALATINDGGGVRLLRLQTIDHPELQCLSADDRAVLTAAVIAMHRGGPPNGNP